VGDDAVSVAELREQLAQLREQLAVVVTALEQRDVEIAELRAENAELRRRLGQNSRNSSKPPSTDGLAKLAPQSLRRRSGRKPGGQPGHPGLRLEQVSSPGEVLRHEPAVCGGAGQAWTVLRRSGCGSGRCSTSRDRGEVTAPTHPAALRLRHGHRRAGARGCRGAGAVRVADRRDHGLPLCRALPVQGPHGDRAGRVVRHPGVGRHEGPGTTTAPARLTGGPRLAAAVLAVLVVVLAVICAVQVYRIGDSGAQAAWGDRQYLAPSAPPPGANG
jgi:Family of unknown function (DUF6444)